MAREGGAGVDQRPVETAIMGGDEIGGVGPAARIGRIERERRDPFRRAIQGIGAGFERGFVHVGQDQAAIGALRQFTRAGRAHAGGGAGD